MPTVLQLPGVTLRTSLRSASRTALLTVALASVACGQTALEPEEGGTDFLMQGEYLGKLETVTPMGVQVIAMGSGTFKAVFLAGGMPGQGWTGERVEADGLISGGKAVFTGNGYTATVAADGQSITGKTAKQELFTLTKTVRKSPTEGMAAPAGAVSLFDGTGVSAWKDGTASMDDRKLFKPEGSGASSGAVTKATFGDFTLHLEFREPFMPSARGQRRGNSGVYLQGRNEVQVLDSFGNTLEFGSGDTMSAKREAGGIFELIRPSVNMAFPPLSWQTYDITFTAARFDAAGKVQTSPAVITVKWNGETVLDKKPCPHSSLLGDPQGPTPGPLRFQAYGDPVFYRNIWITDGSAALAPAPRKLRHRQGSADAPDIRSVDGRLAQSRPAYGFYLLPVPDGKLSHPRGTSL